MKFPQATQIIHSNCLPTVLQKTLAGANTSLSLFYLCENALTQVLSHLEKVNSFFSTDQALTFITLKTVYLLSFVTLCLCLQYFHNNFLFLSKKSSLFDPVTDSLHTHGTTIGPAAFFVLYNLLRTLGITAQTSQSLLGHTA